MSCPVCGAQTHPGDNFCLRCGTRLAPPSPAQFIVPGATGSPMHRLSGPAAIAGSALLLVLALLALFWVGTSTQPGVPNAAGADGLIAAVQANNEAQIVALRTLNAQALAGKMAGQALRDNQDMINALRQAGLSQEAHLIHIDYLDPRFLSPDRATIRTVEQWDAVYHRLDNGQVARTDPPQTLHEIYYLSRQNGQWIVERVDIQADTRTPGPDQ